MNNETDYPLPKPIHHLPKQNQPGTYKATSPALDYAKMALDQLHTDEIWTLAERLDIVMKETAKRFIEETRK